METLVSAKDTTTKEIILAATTITKITLRTVA